MKIALCTPFKPVDHPRISGDVTIARDIYETLRGFGHEVIPVTYFPAKGIYWKPERWLGARAAVQAMVAQVRGADCWLTYGSYYKVPDVFGPVATRHLHLPYFIFQASYATNRAKRIATWPGYILNKRAMLRADHVFCNRMKDMRGCEKLLPADKFSYVRPGLPGDLFDRDAEAREQLRREWQVGETPVVISTAMMRHGVKAKGLQWVIESCTDLVRQGIDLKLVIAGDGPQREILEGMAREQLGNRVTFLGLVDRHQLGAVFSAGDVFAFPGLEESVGMVYLEAQRCGLPVVATDDEGAPHVVSHGYSGLVTSVSKTEFTEALGRLVTDKAYRTLLGGQAMEYVQRDHRADRNYREMAQMMEATAAQREQNR